MFGMFRKAPPMFSYFGQPLINCAGQGTPKREGSRPLVAPRKLHAQPRVSAPSILVLKEELPGFAKHQVWIFHAQKVGTLAHCLHPCPCGQLLELLDSFRSRSLTTRIVVQEQQILSLETIHVLEQI